PIGMFVPIVRSFFLKRLYHSVFGREMLQNTVAIIATAEQEKEELVSGGVPAEKIVIRRNGVTAPEKMPEPGVFRKSLNIPVDARLVLFLGRLSQKKSPDLLLQAFAQVAAAEGAAHLAFAGPDESRMLGKLQDMAAQTGLQHRVHF